MKFLKNILINVIANYLNEIYYYCNYSDKYFFVFQNKADISNNINETIDNSETTSAALESLDGIREEKKWLDRMDQVGTSKAYEEFKSEYADKHFGIQHTIAHIVGELIYEKEGVKGLAICDSTFAFGCYHSFFGQALAGRGLDVVSMLDQACLDKFGPLGTGCQHGIGHGLMEYYGSDNLLLALDGCKATTQIRPLFGCTSGVFMEYNVPIVFTPETAVTQPRTINFDDPYFPCPELPNKYQESCYYEMTQWWDKDTTYRGGYKKIGQLCDNVKGEKNREACFFGVGNITAPSSNYDVAEAIKKCDQMPDNESLLLCRSGSSWSFYATPKYRHLAYKMCEDFDRDFRKKCAQKSDLIGEGLINKIYLNE